MSILADFVVPSLHRLVEPEVLFSKVRKVLLHRLEFRFQVLGVGDAITPGADSRVWPTPEEVDSMQVRRDYNSSAPVFFASRIRRRASA